MARTLDSKSSNPGLSCYTVFLGKKLSHIQCFFPPRSLNGFHQFKFLRILKDNPSFVCLTSLASKVEYKYILFK